ncbi:MAG: SMP-30/gluconolactonase/LRE family protein [Bacteroidota bacterium]
MKNIEPIFNTLLEHGEGPVWDEKTAQLYWVDLLRGKYFRGNLVNDTLVNYAIGQPLGALAMRQDKGLVMALRDGFARFDEDTQQLEMVKDSPILNLPNVRFNDGSVDPKGRFLAGTMTFDGDEQIGKLYSLDEQQSYRELDDNFLIPNGMGWNKNGDQFYLIDSFQNVLFAYDYDLEAGLVSNKRVHIQFEKQEIPDGMCMDAEGSFWIAMWGGSKILNFSPKGKRIDQIEMPVPYPTSCCFGGPKLNQLFITSSQLPLNEHEKKQFPLSGRTFMVELDVVGKSDYRYNG